MSFTHFLSLLKNKINPHYIQKLNLYVTGNEVVNQQKDKSVNVADRSIKQNSQCTYNVTSRRVHKTIVAMEKQLSIIYFCVCVHTCERGCRKRVCTCACVALLIQHATRRHIAICGLWLHRIFRHYLINGMIFGEMLLNIQYAFQFSLQHLLEKFLIQRRI